MYALDGPDFFALAYRMPAYPGVMRVRLDLQEQQQQVGPVDPGGRFGELTEDQVEQLRQQQRIRDHPKALRPGEQPRYVPIDQLIREST